MIKVKAAMVDLWWELDGVELLISNGLVSHGSFGFASHKVH